jgi:hypothetical protein
MTNVKKRGKCSRSIVGVESIFPISRVFGARSRQVGSVAVPDPTMMPH